jgi:tetratricopeptide (TPR) repeat protein
LLDLVGGHPLAARLLVDVLRNESVEHLSSETAVAPVAGQLAQALLARVALSPWDESIMETLSVFRLPIRWERLQKLSGVDFKEADLRALADRCILSFDGQQYDAHEAIRRHFHEKAALRTDLTEMHRRAAAYYESLYDESVMQGASNPTLAAELVHHLSYTGDILRATRLKLTIVEEIKPVARSIYRVERNYDRALELFRLAERVAPDDPEVSAYVGRCYARLGQWGESDNAFHRALDAAARAGRPTWWIHRDWGHIRARFKYYSLAEEHLARAAESHPNDPAIKSSLAYMHWQLGHVERAYELFEEAYALSHEHQYTLMYFARFLEDSGDVTRAARLRTELADARRLDNSRIPRDFELDEDYYEL